MVYPLWQYEHAIVSTEAIVIFSMDYLAAASACQAPPQPLPSRTCYRMPLTAGTPGIDAVALSVQWTLAPSASPYTSPYSRHELYFLPERRGGDAPLDFSAEIHNGAVRLTF